MLKHETCMMYCTTKEWEEFKGDAADAFAKEGVESEFEIHGDYIKDINSGTPWAQYDSYRGHLILSHPMNYHTVYGDDA